MQEASISLVHLVAKGSVLVEAQPSELPHTTLLAVRPRVEIQMKRTGPFLAILEALEWRGETGGTLLAPEAL